MAQIRVGEHQQQQDSQVEKIQAGDKTAGGGAKMKPSYKHIPHSQKPPHLVAKRNARERRRVQAVNQAFYKLRKSVPIENRNKRVSKVKTLQRAIDYIRRLEMILAEDETQQGGGDSSKANNVVAALLPHMQSHTDSKLHQETATPLQHNKGPLNPTTSYDQNEPQPSGHEVRQERIESGGGSGELQAENHPMIVKESPRAKERPKRLQSSGGARNELVPVKRQQRAPRRQAKQTGNSNNQNNKPQETCTDELHQNNRQNNHHHQLARDPLALVHCSQSSGLLGSTPQEDDNNYGSLKSTTIVTTQIEATAEAPATTTNFYFPTSEIGTAVSYGRPRDTTAASSLVAATVASSVQHHYPNHHHYQYYTDSSANERQQPHQLAYNHHLQLPLDVCSQQQQQHRADPGGEIPSSSTNGLCDYTQASYHHGGGATILNSNNCSPLSLELVGVSSTAHNQQHRLINHNSFTGPIDSPLATSLSASQQSYLSPEVSRQHHYQQPPNTWHLQQQQQQQTAGLPSELGRGSKQTFVHTHDKTAGIKSARSLGHFSSAPPSAAPLATGPNVHMKRNDYEQEPAVVVAADSTSSSGIQRGLANRNQTHSQPPHSNQQHHQKPPVSIGSPPVSICSSSSLSPSTTFKSLDLSGGSSNGGGGCSSSTSTSVMFNGGNTNSTRSEKSPTTSSSNTTSASATPVVCRPHLNGNNNSNHDSNNNNGAHSTTARDYMEQASNGRQQQVNNYTNQQLPNYAAHLSYGAPISGSGGPDGSYHRLERPQQQQQPQRQPDEQRAIKSIDCVENKSRTGVGGGGGGASLHAVAAAASIGAASRQELQYRNGSRSSPAISSPPAQQLPLVGGNYLANNNLHCNNQHTEQLFQQQQQSTYYHHHQQQQQLHHQHHHHYQQHQQQQQQYQGQHFLVNHNGLQQQQQQPQHHSLNHNSNHLSDHHHNHHLQSEPVSSATAELRQPNANTNTTEPIMTTNIINQQQQQPSSSSSSSEQQLVANSSSATIQAPTQYTVLPL